MTEIIYGVYGVIGTLIITYFWKKMPWVKEYITRKEMTAACAQCELHAQVVSMCSDIGIVKAVILELAVKAELPVEKYKAMVGSRE